MWIARLQFNALGGPLGQLARKHKVTVTGYPLSFFKVEKKAHSFLAGFVYGSKTAVKNYEKDLKKEPRLVHLELKDNFGLFMLTVPPEWEPFYNPWIIHARPVVIYPDGQEVIEVASFRREEITKLVNYLKLIGGKLLKLTRSKLAGISIIGIIPELTKKQRTAFELAMREGYYEYPRKIELTKLAKLMKISYSTYQAHLRKAEQSLLKFAANQLPTLQTQ